MAIIRRQLEAGAVTVRWPLFLAFARGSHGLGLRVRTSRRQNGLDHSLTCMRGGLMDDVYCKRNVELPRRRRQSTLRFVFSPRQLTQLPSFA